MNKPEIDKVSNLGVVKEERKIRVATKEDWDEIVQCEFLYVQFGLPLCSLYNAFRNKTNRVCRVCIDKEIECPAFNKKGAKEIEREYLV